MIHISKDPFGPIRKNVTFIPFRIGGTAELVTGDRSHRGRGDCQKVGVGYRGPGGNWRRVWVRI